MKTCKADNCLNNSFGGGYCKYHQYLRRMQGGDLYKRKTKDKAKEDTKSNEIRANKPRSRVRQARIPHESKKRKITAQIYREICDVMWEKALKDKTNYCFFSGELMTEREDFHHTAGRDGFLFIEEDKLVLAKRKYHSMYHRCTVDQLKSESWYNGFLDRLKAKDYSLWQKEMRKHDKSDYYKKDRDLFGNVE